MAQPEAGHGPVAGSCRWLHHASASGGVLRCGKKSWPHALGREHTAAAGGLRCGGLNCERRAKLSIAAVLLCRLGDQVPDIPARTASAQCSGCARRAAAGTAAGRGKACAAAGG